MSLKDRLKDMKKESKSIQHVMIEKKLSDLFYLPQKIDEEIKFLQIKRGNDNQERIGLHASAIIASENEFCYREQVLSLFYKQNQGTNIAPGLKRIFMEGDCIHEKWQRLMIRAGMGKAEHMDKTCFNKKYDLSFTPDCIINIGKKKYVVEIKSMNTYIFKKSKTHPSGAKQLRLYMFLTGIEDGFVLMEDKNDQNFKIQIVKHDYEDVIEYEERLQKIQVYKKKFINERKMPKRKCDSPTCKRAGKCNMFDACFNIGIGRVKL